MPDMTPRVREEDGIDEPLGMLRFVRTAEDDTVLVNCADEVVGVSSFFCKDPRPKWLKVSEDGFTVHALNGEYKYCWTGAIRDFGRVKVAKKVSGP